MALSQSCRRSRTSRRRQLVINMIPPNHPEHEQPDDPAPVAPPNSALSDPALQTAIRSLKLLGAASAMWGFVFVFVWGYFNRFERFRPHFIALGLIVWAIPGVLFFVCGWMIERER